MTYAASRGRRQTTGPGEPAPDPTPRNENAAGGEPAAQDQTPTGGDADRPGHHTAPPESATRQRARIEAHFRQFGSLSTPEGRNELGIMHPAARVQELRDSGHDIVTIWTEHTDSTGRRHRVARYHWRGLIGVQP